MFLIVISFYQLDDQSAAVHLVVGSTPNHIALHIINLFQWKL